MKNQIMERHKPRRRVSFHLCGHVHSCQSMRLHCFYSIWCELPTFPCPFVCNSLENFFQHPLLESSFLNLLFVAVACYLLRFFRPPVWLTPRHYTVCCWLWLRFSPLEYHRWLLFFIPRVFSPFWPIVACKFLLPFPILLDWSSLLLLFFSFSFLFLPPLHITQRLSSLVVPAWRTVSIRAHRHSSSSSLSAIYYRPCPLRARSLRPEENRNERTRLLGVALWRRCTRER